MHGFSVLRAVAGYAARCVGLAREPLPLQQPPQSLPPHSADRVEAWFDDIQLSPTALALVDGAPFTASGGRALSSVEDLREAFKRLDAQLEIISDARQTYTPHP